MARSDPQVTLRLPPDLKARVEAAAEESNRSMNGEIVARLEESFRAATDAELRKVAAELGLLLLATAGTTAAVADVLVELAPALPNRPDVVVRAKSLNRVAALLEVKRMSARRLVISEEEAARQLARYMDVLAGGFAEVEVEHLRPRDGDERQGDTSSSAGGTRTRSRRAQTSRTP
jgi:hypothetical protein